MSADLNNKFKQVGKVMEAHGLRGDLYCLVFSGDISWVEALKELQLKSKQGSELFKVEKLKVFKRGFIVKLEGFNDRNHSELYKGAELWVSEKLFVSGDGETPYLREILNFSVVDTNLGAIGQVVDFSSNGLQDLLIVEKNEKKIEIPFVKNFVLNMDFENKVLHMILPEGLLDINETDGADEEGADVED